MIGKNDKCYGITHNFKNVTWIDHVPYDILPQYLSYFDICMIPFKLTEMMKGCDPIKFYEYLSAGKPIITTRIEPLQVYDDVCYFIDHSNYKNVIESICINTDIDNNLQINERQLVAKNNSWTHRTNDIINAIDTKINMTVIYAPFISWSKMFQRPQQMISGLSKKPGVRCIFIDIHMENDMPVKKINGSLILSRSYSAAKKYVKGKTILYFNNPGFVRLIKKYKYDVSVFELVDNPTDEFSDMTTHLTEAVKMADRLSLTSRVMERFLQGRKYELIPNGTDWHHFKYAENKLKKPKDFPKTEKPIIGYYGAHASWVDWDLVRKIANISKYHVVMIGRMAKGYTHCFEHENITWLPVKPYAILPYYLSWFDVCMIPFKLTNMIKGCDPIKFYEYSAAGKPIVATEMQELRKFGKVPYFLNHTNYSSIVHKAFKERNDQNLIKSRQRFAMKNGWDVRVNQFLEMVS